MYYREDWFMRQIETTIAVIIQMVTARGRHAAPVASALFDNVMALLKQGEICEAENLLFFAAEAHEETSFETALTFYSELNKLDDKELADKNFSRDEIRSGLQEVCRLNGLADDLFFSEP